MSTPLFSIITICFNSAATIERTIKSVLAQTLDDFEYIIVDGVSKDSTLDIVKKYEPLFNGRMKWNSEPDKGIYDAMNKGIERSIGRIIGIVNSDDWLEPDALSWVNSKFLDNNEREDCLYCGGIRFHATDGNIQELMPNINLFNKGASEFIMRGIRHPATFVPRFIYEKIGCFDPKIRIIADTDFLLRSYYNNIRVIEIHTILSNMADGGVSNVLTWKSGLRSFADKKIMLSKFGVSTFKCLYILSKTLLVIVIKRLPFIRKYIKHS
jgi:glycosyltransferase involved in cell wall biosynthesis